MREDNIRDFCTGSSIDDREGREIKEEDLRVFTYKFTVVSRYQH